MSSGSSSIDVVSQLQEEVNRFASHTFNTIGILQRDSVPAPIETPTPASSGPSTTEGSTPAEAETAKAKVHEMANEIFKCSKTIEKLVEALPPHNQSEEEQLQELSNLQEESDRLATELQLELKKVKGVLGQVSQTYADIVDDQLARRLKKPKTSAEQRDQEHGVISWQQTACENRHR